jgi:HAD superfamily hydrolase (TIGR01509 family)
MNLGTMDIKCIMFDLDGTLIDSVPAYFRLMASIFDIVGLPRPPKPLVAEFMTRGGTDVFEKMIPEEMKGRKEEIIQEIMTVGRRMSYDMFRDDVDVFPGVRELFGLLAQRDIRIGIVSSTDRRNIEKKLMPLARIGIKNGLAAVIAIEDAPERKPAPDPLIECARRLAVAPEKCVYVGDSRVDIQAGNAAGMLTIGVLTGLDDADTLKSQYATLIVPSVDDIRSLFPAASRPSS